MLAVKVQSRAARMLVGEYETTLNALRERMVPVKGGHTDTNAHLDILDRIPIPTRKTTSSSKHDEASNRPRPSVFWAIWRVL